MPTQQQVLKRITLHAPPAARSWSPARYFAAGLICGAVLSLGAGIAALPHARDLLVQFVASRAATPQASPAPSPAGGLATAVPLAESEAPRLGQ